MKQFSQEFKNSVIERIRNGETQMGVAKSLGISCKTVNSWWRKAKEELPQEQLSAEQEIARLKKLLREREAEIDFLKKSDGVLRQNALRKYVYLKCRIDRAEIGRHCYLPIT